jgi:hypothetical protein
MIQACRRLIFVLAAALLASEASAATYTNITGIVVDIPAGDAAFADQAVSFSPGLVRDPDFPSPLPLVPFAPFIKASETLGVPDQTQTSAFNCATGAQADFPFFSNPALWADCNFASMGVGGSLVVRFTDNVINGGGDSGPDIWIFEVGPDIEDTFVDISTDGMNWQSVGKVFGSTAGVDLDAFGFGPGDTFTYLRLTDDPNEGDGSPGASNVGETVGADIDAIAAGRISVVPAPAAGWLAATGFLILGRRLRRRR